MANFAPTNTPSEVANQQAEQITPYQSDRETKKNQVARMFNGIAHSYDLLNHLFSFGIDRIWRKKAINLLVPLSPNHCLDVATGTGDFAIATCKKLNPEKITGIDIAEEMLVRGRLKASKKGMDKVISFEYGDSENMTFPDNTFDSATVAFGVRNFEHTLNGLTEIYRVLKPGAKFVVLEFSKPRHVIVKWVFGFYFNRVIPFFGRMISGDKRAYRYLPESVATFPEGEDFIRLMETAGFRQCTWKSLTFGICALYAGQK